MSQTFVEIPSHVLVRIPDVLIHNFRYDYLKRPVCLFSAIIHIRSEWIGMMRGIQFSAEKDFRLWSKF